MSIGGPHEVLPPHARQRGAFEVCQVLTRLEADEVRRRIDCASIDPLHLSTQPEEFERFTNGKRTRTRPGSPETGGIGLEREGIEPRTTATQRTLAHKLRARFLRQRLPGVVV